MFFGAKKKNLLEYSLIQANPLFTWECDKKLGFGNFAEVFLVRRKSDGMTAALKSATLEDESTRKEDMEDLLNEIRILKMLHSPFVVKYFEGYFEERSPPVIHLLLEYCDKTSIGSLMEEFVEVSENQIKAVLYQAFCGLDHIHKMNIIHRDIKSLNLLVTSCGDVKITDFGVSAICSPGNMTRNTFVGTINWMAPEVMKCRADLSLCYNEKCDIWSMGITAIELAQLKVPFEGCSFNHITYSLSNGIEPRIEKFSRSAEFYDFITKTVTIDCKARLSARDCLSHPFLKDDIAKSKSPVVELFSIEVSEEIEETTSDTSQNDDLALLNSTDDTALLDSSIEVSSQDWDEPTSPVNINQNQNSRAPAHTYKTLRKTISYKIDGQTKTKTVVQMLDSSSVHPKEEKRYARDIDMELKEFKKIAKFELKQRKNLELQIAMSVEEMEKRNKLEKIHCIDRMNKEIEAFHKLSTKELEKYLCTHEASMMKQMKKLKSELEAKKKAIRESYKAKAKEAKKLAKGYGKSKYEIAAEENKLKEEENAECSFACSECMAEWSKYEEEKSKTFKEVLKESVDARSCKVEALECELWTLELTHHLQFYKMTIKCDLLALNLSLNQQIARNRQEKDYCSKLQAKKIEELDIKHLREQKEVPKLLRSKCSQVVNDYRKLLAQNKSVSKAERISLLKSKTEEENAKIITEESNLRSRLEIEKISMMEAYRKQMSDLSEKQEEGCYLTYAKERERTLVRQQSHEQYIIDFLQGLVDRKREITKIKSDTEHSIMKTEMRLISTVELSS